MAPSPRGVSPMMMIMMTMMMRPSLLFLLRRGGRGSHPAQCGTRHRAKRGARRKSFRFGGLGQHVAGLSLLPICAASLPTIGRHSTRKRPSPRDESPTSGSTATRAIEGPITAWWLRNLMPIALPCAPGDVRPSCIERTALGGRSRQLRIEHWWGCRLACEFGLWLGGPA